MDYVHEILIAIKAQDLLTYLALVLAYIAYVWTVNRGFDSWKSLFISFKNDLDNQKAWLSKEYSSNTYRTINVKRSYAPFHTILPLAFESLPEIIRRGVAELKFISKQFMENISLFNERIIAFNSFLDEMKNITSANPVMSEKLKNIANDLGVEDENVSFDDFKNKIEKLKTNDEIGYLAENIRRLNWIIHVNMIGDKNNEDRLYFLYTQISEELKNILDNFSKKKPLFIRYKWLFIALSFPVFILLEILLK